MNTEYVRNLHSNYERIRLEEKPEENKYQYCILTRGGIKGLLPCSLRFLDGEAFLYYDITSMQNITQIYQKSNISREWLLAFIDSIRSLWRELGRFLLQEDHVIWSPEQVFQDLESNVFAFLFLPYYQGDNGWMKLMSFLVERIDYEDEKLVECVYKMYEQSEKAGAVYLQEQIFKDVGLLEADNPGENPGRERTLSGSRQMDYVQETEGALQERAPESGSSYGRESLQDRRKAQEHTESEDDRPIPAGAAYPEDGKNRKSQEIPERERGKKKFSIFDTKKKKNRDQEVRESYREAAQQMMMGYSVAEEINYEEYGRTTFIGDKPEKKEAPHRLYYGDGRKASDLELTNLLIGKYKDKVDLYLEDDSISRMHARILKDPGGHYFLEDSNSTNGSFVNGERLQPYERRELKPGDELRFGNQTLLYR